MIQEECDAESLSGLNIGEEDSAMTDDDTDPMPIKGPKTHPHIATIIIDPADWRRIETVFEDRPEVKIIGSDRQTPDRWTIFVGCASERVRDFVEDNW